jgi:TP901 family phage tail tape measure protein
VSFGNSRDLNVRLTLDGVPTLERGFKSASSSASVFEREMAKVEARQASFKRDAGRGLIATGAAIAAGLALSTKAAIDWESAWAGVTKTVSGSAAQMSALEGGLRDLAKELPASHQQIAAVAEAAGQLGIKRGAILSFTKTMIDLGVTTNLSAEDAATALARLSNIMQTPQNQIDRMGATIAALGNAGASTETEIVDMGLRIAGAGKQIGLTESQVLGFANALSSVGIEAEAGGSAISTTFIKIAKSVETGGKQLDEFASVAGVSSSRFKQMFADDAGGAITAFITGLGKLKGEGKSTFGALDQLGLGGIRVRDTLLRASNAGDLLTSSLKTGAKAWRDDTALLKEAEARYGTTASKMLIAKNQVNDLAISIGQTFLPVLGDASAGIGAVTDMIGSLPGPAKEALAIIGLLGAGVALTGGAMLLAVPKIVAFKTAMADMGPRTQAVGKGLGRVGSVLTGPWGIAILGATVALGVLAKEHADAKQRVDELTTAIQEDSGALKENTHVAAANQLEKSGVLKDAQTLGLSLKTVTDAYLGNADAIREVQIATKLFEGQPRGTQGAAAIRLADAISTGNAATDAAVAKAKRLAAASGDAGDQEKKQKQSTDDLTTAIDKYKAALDALNGVNITAAQQQIALKRAFIDSKKAIDDHKKVSLDERSALLDLASQANQTAGAIAEQTGSQEKGNAVLRTARARFIDTAEAMGLSAGQAKKLADKLLAIPKHTPAEVTTPGLDSATTRANALLTTLHNLTAHGWQVAISSTGEIVGHGHGSPVHPAGGGYIRGPGTSTSDSIPARLSDGEYVVRAAAVERIGVPTLDKMNRLGFAGGGYVPSSHLSDPSSLVSQATDAKGHFSYARYQRLLARSTAKDRQWQHDLLAIARRLGGPTAAAVEEMGAEGAAIAHQLATGPRRKDAGTAARIRRLSSADEAFTANRPATLASLLASTTKDNKATAAFRHNLDTLAGRGQMALARYLDDMGGPDAQRLARQALADPKVAARLNNAVARSAGLSATVDASGSGGAAGGAGTVNGGNGTWFSPTVNLWTLPAQDAGKQVEKGLEYVAFLHLGVSTRRRAARNLRPGAARLRCAGLLDLGSRRLGLECCDERVSGLGVEPRLGVLEGCHDRVAGPGVELGKTLLGLRVLERGQRRSERCHHLVDGVAAAGALNDGAAGVGVGQDVNDYLGG